MGLSLEDRVSRFFKARNQILEMVLKKSGKKAVYYGSLEYKESTDAIKGSRACGVLLAGESAYVVYNTMTRRMKWAQEDGSINAHLDRAYAG